MPKGSPKSEEAITGVEPIEPLIRMIRGQRVILDADLAKGALESAGIEAIVRPDDAGGVRPNLWMGGVGLLVRAEDLKDAKQILGDD